MPCGRMDAAGGQGVERDDPADHFSLRPELEPPRTVLSLCSAPERLGLKDRCNALLAAACIRRWRNRYAAPATRRLGAGIAGIARRVDLFRRLDTIATANCNARMARSDGRSSCVHSLGRIRLTRGSRNFYRKKKLSEPGKHATFARTLYLLRRPGSGEGRAVACGSDPGLSRQYDRGRWQGDSLFRRRRARSRSTPPLGPFLPAGVKQLADDEIVLADWKESPLPRKVGEKVTLSFFPPTHQGEPPKQSATFRLAGFVPLEGVTGDPDLTRSFPASPTN